MIPTNKVLRCGARVTGARAVLLAIRVTVWYLAQKQGFFTAKDGNLLREFVMHRLGGKRGHVGGHAILAIRPGRALALPCREACPGILNMKW